MPELTQAWKCSYCNTTSTHKASIVRHEKKHCHKNRGCKVCKHFEIVWNDNGLDRFWKERWCMLTEDGEELNCLKCNCPDFLGEEPKDAGTR